MKIIKSIPILIVCVCATGFLYAQELKAESVKPVETKIPAAANKPSPQPEFKPQAATEKPVAAEAPKSLVGEEEAKPQEKEKPAMKVIEPATSTIPGGEEGKKILAGKAENPKQPGPTTPNTIDQNIKPLPVTKSTALKQVQKQ